MSRPTAEVSVVFIPAQEWEDYADKHVQDVLVQALDDDRALQVIKKDFTRADVVKAFQTAFEAVGGVTRLALYAHENYEQFIKHYARLLPSQASSALGESSTLVIEHRLPRTSLDA